MFGFGEFNDSKRGMWLVSASRSKPWFLDADGV